MVKNLAATWETHFRSLGWEDPLDKGMATHSSILGWESPRTEEPGGLQSMGLQRVNHDRATKHLRTEGGFPMNDKHGYLEMGGPKEERDQDTLKDHPG